MLFLEVLFLAILQGIGEFLPISSSGHLVVGMALCEQWGHPIQEKLALNVILHLGTLFSILVFFRKRLAKILLEEPRVVVLGVWATLPAVVVGLGLNYGAQNLLQSPLLTGFAFLITGIGLLWTKHLRPGDQECRQLGWGESLLIGCAQALAVLPGISRSGATIVAGLAVGLSQTEAAVFSFLLAIPVIAGAGLLETVEMFRDNANSFPLPYLGFGMGVSFVVGLVALAWLVRWLQEGRLYWFAYWLFTIGPVVILWQILQN